jgi:polygalacturonase
MPILITEFLDTDQRDCIATGAIQNAIDTCAARGGGTLIFPPGLYLSGALWLRDNITLHLESGAVLQAASEVSHFPIWTPQWDRTPTHAALINAEGLHNITLTGRGTIDGAGSRWWDLHHQGKLTHDRPRLVRFIDCRNVLIENLTLTQSPFWTLKPTACEDITLRGVIIRNPPDSPNTDGINPDSCRNVHISDCHVDVGDDCITIKSGSENDGRLQRRPCENIVITNCTMIHGHGGVVIGSEMSGSVRNVAISNCAFVGTDRGIRIKSRRGRGGVVEDVRVSNIVMDQVLCPIVINLFYGCGAWKDPKVTDSSAQPVTDGTPRFRRLRFSGISARRVKYSAAHVVGLPEMFVQDVTFNDIAIDLDPENAQAGQSAMAPNQPDLCRAGFVLRNVEKVRLSNISITNQLGPAIDVGNSKDVATEDAIVRELQPTR